MLTPSSKGTVIPGKAEVADRLAQLFADQACMAERAMRQQHAQFIAAQARQDVAVAHLRLQQLGQQLQQHVAGTMAAGVVDDLELVEVQVQQRVCVAFLLGRVQGAGHQVLELAPVDQAGERVVASLPRQLLAQLAFMADVAKHHDRAEDLAVARPDRRGRVGNGDAAPVAREQLRMAGQADGLALVQAFDGHMLERLAGVFIDQLQGFPDIAAVRQRIAPAGQLFGHPVQVTGLALRVGRHHAVADRIERHFGQFLAFGNGDRLLALFGDVPDHAQRAHRPALPVAEHLRPGFEPVCVAIGPEHAVLQFVSAAAVDARLQGVQYPLAIIVMDMAEKVAERLVQRAWWQAQQGSAAGRPVHHPFDDLAVDDARIPDRHFRGVQGHLQTPLHIAHRVLPP